MRESCAIMDHRKCLNSKNKRSALVSIQQKEVMNIYDDLFLAIAPAVPPSCIYSMQLPCLICRLLVRARQLLQCFTKVSQSAWLHSSSMSWTVLHTLCASRDRQILANKVSLSRMLSHVWQFSNCAHALSLCSVMHVFRLCFFFFSIFFIILMCNWCSVAMGGQPDRRILLLWQPAIVSLLLCYGMLSWFGK